MAKKKTASKKTKKAIAASIAESLAREKDSPKPGAVSPISREELIKQMGEAAYRLGCIQTEMGMISDTHEAAQKEVQALKQLLDKRGKG